MPVIACYLLTQDVEVRTFGKWGKCIAPAINHQPLTTNH
ncbi:MAG: hypothetical protein KIPDCIKN_02444 [Haliscomenobacter sp.]|nr:hypothetical protein [Haliscomenobacter sp.]